MLAGLPVTTDAVHELADLVRDVDDDLADRLERAIADEVKLLALTLDERADALRARGSARRAGRAYAPCCSLTTSGEAPRGLTDDKRGGIRVRSRAGDAASGSGKYR